MPPQLQALLQNRTVLLAAVGGLVVVVVLVLVLVFTMGGNSGPKDPGAQPLNETQLILVKGIKAGKALEVQALLAREGIHLNTAEGTGGTFDLMFDEKATLNERDRAMITLVQSGLMDGNMGFEAFDSSDLMASREEKRIKLLRAQQGEMARIIRKIDPIQDASVRITLPDPSIFASEQKPVSASIQVTLAPGERLTRDKVRAIINLAVGSVQGLEAKNVALTDTNGNTYNSVLNSSMELQDKVEEQDNYMKQKVSTQLDRLVGAGNYVVTVSTLLREARRETLVQSVEPDKSGIRSKQQFTERLNSNSSNGPAGGPVSSFIPPELETDAQGQNSSDNRGYVREGVETAYENGRTQYVESSVPGMVEDITIAVTIDENHMPNLEAGQLQQLLARAASPKVNPANVSVATTDFQTVQPIVQDDPLPLEPNPMMTWLPWMIFSVASGFVILVILIATRRSRTSEYQLTRTQQEIEALRQLTAQQQAALQQQQQQAMQLQQQQQQQLLATQQSRLQDTQRLEETLQQLQSTLQQQSLPALPAATQGIPVSARSGGEMSDALRQWLRQE